MTDGSEFERQRQAADKEWLASLPRADRKAEMERRKARFADQHGKLTIIGPKNFKERAVKNLKLWAIIIGLIAALFIAVGIFGPDTTGVRHLDVGDCVMLPDDGEYLARLDTPDCSEPHEGQLFHEFVPVGIAQSEYLNTCLAQRASVDLSSLDVPDDFEAEIGHYAILAERDGVSATTNVFCFVRFPTLQTGSVVSTD